MVSSTSRSYSSLISVCQNSHYFAFLTRACSGERCCLHSTSYRPNYSSLQNSPDYVLGRFRNNPLNALLVRPVRADIRSTFDCSPVSESSRRPWRNKQMRFFETVVGYLAVLLFEEMVDLVCFYAVRWVGVVLNCLVLFSQPLVVVWEVALV